MAAVGEGPGDMHTNVKMTVAVAALTVRGGGGLFFLFLRHLLILIRIDINPY